MIIQRKSPEATEATRKKLLGEASRKQKTLDPRSLVAAVIGPLLLDALPHADANMYRRLAHVRRRREAHICNPVRG